MMKKTISKSLTVVISCLMALTIITVFSVIAGFDCIHVYAEEANTSWYSEDATTYNISSASDLMGFAELVNSGITFEGKTVYLDQNIDLSSVDNWVPIGIFTKTSASRKYFKGTFDGQNNKITNYKLRDDNDYSEDGGQFSTLLTNNFGLFSCISNGAIKNLTVQGDILLTKPVDHLRSTTLGFTGGIVAYAANSNITNCSFEGSISSGYVVGGVIGRGLNTNLNGCTFEGDVKGYYYVGGVAGQVYGNNNGNPSFDNCTSKGSVTAYKQYAGGIFASTTNTSANSTNYSKWYSIINNCTTLEDSTVESAGYAGGIVADSCSEIKNSSNHADVSITSSSSVDSVAGIVSSQKANINDGITNCINYGIIHSDGNGNAAGIAVSGADMVYTNIANIGAISEKKEACGLVANVYGTQTIKNGFNYGIVTGSKVYPISYETNCENVYYDSSTESSVGVAKSKEEFKDRTVVDLLNRETDSPIWFQNVDYPDFATNMTPVENLTIDENAEVGINAQVALTTSLTPDNATNKGLVYSSSDETVATVTGDGKVTGIKAGRADITVMALYDGKTAVCKVTVKDLDQEAADAVIAALKAIDPQKASIDQLKAVQKKYDALTPAQKAIVDADPAAAAAKKAVDAKVEEMDKAAGTTQKPQSTQSGTTQKPQSTQSTRVAVKTGTKFSVKGYKYTVTSNLKKNPTVTITGYKNRKLKKITVPASVKYKKVTFKVTAIGKGAFKNQKKAKSAVVGKNVKNMGASAFEGDARLVKITVKSSVLTKVGARALKKTPKLKTIKVPKKKLKKYKKLFTGKGQKKTVKITK